MSTFVNNIYCVVNRKDSAQGDMHMVAVVAGCRNAMVGTAWSSFCLGHTNGLRKSYSHLAGAPLQAMKAIWALNGCLVTEKADRAMQVR